MPEGHSIRYSLRRSSFIIRRNTLNRSLARADRFPLQWCDAMSRYSRSITSMFTVAICYAPIFRAITINSAGHVPERPISLFLLLFPPPIRANDSRLTNFTDLLNRMNIQMDNRRREYWFALHESVLFSVQSTQFNSYTLDSQTFNSIFRTSSRSKSILLFSPSVN